MGKITSYQDLLVWQKSMKLAAHIYRLVPSWPTWELYGLVAQIRRSATSVPANIAEGHGRRSTREYLHFLSIAKGSLRETETFLLLALELNYLTSDKASSCFDIMTEVGKMLSTLETRVLEAEARKRS
jgi:four helix bundle protein